jgi:hypothetical protein
MMMMFLLARELMYGGLVCFILIIAIQVDVGEVDARHLVSRGAPAARNATFSPRK